MKNIARISSGFKGERFVAIPSFVIDDIKSHELGRELYITGLYYYPRACFHYCECSAEQAVDYVLIYCVEGKGWVDIEGRRHPVERDQFLILPLRKAYSYGSSLQSPWTIYRIHFNGEKAGFFSSGFDKPTAISRDSASRNSERLNIFEDIYASLHSGCHKNGLLYATTGFFHFLGTVKFLAQCGECSPKDTKHEDTISLAIHYIKENMSRKIALGEIANYVGLSESYLSALFVKETGMSPLRYLAHLRFEQACHYLGYTNMKVNQICPLIGFEDSLYFSRAFAKTMGMSPSEYRANRSLD